MRDLKGLFVAFQRIPLRVGAPPNSTNPEGNRRPKKTLNVPGLKEALLDATAVAVATKDGACARRGSPKETYQTHTHI